METGLHHHQQQQHQQQQSQLMGNDRYSNSGYMNSGGTFNISQGIPNLSQQLPQQQQRQSMLGRNQGLMSLSQNTMGSQSIGGSFGQHDGNQHQQYLGSHGSSMSSLGLGRPGYSSQQGNSLGLQYTQSRSVSDILNQQQQPHRSGASTDGGIQFDFPSLPATSSSNAGLGSTSRFQSLVQPQREEDFTIANEDFPALPGSHVNSSNGQQHQQSSQVSSQGVPLQQGVFKSETSLLGPNGWSGQNGSMSLGGYATNAGGAQLQQGQLHNQTNSLGFSYGNGSSQLLHQQQQLSDRMRELSFQDNNNNTSFQQQLQQQQQQGMSLAGSGHLGGSVAVGAVGRPSGMLGAAQSVIGAMSSQSTQSPHMGAGVGLLMQQQQISGGLLGTQGAGSGGGLGIGLQHQQPSELTGPAADVSALMDGIDLAGLLGGPDSSRAAASVNKEAKYGLAGLIDVIKMTDKDMNTLALGADLTAFGLNLNSAESLYAAFSSPFSDQPAAVDSSFATPPCYLMHPPSLKAEHLSKFQIETLFYMFYAMPRDFLQAVAAQELYRRDWRFHGELRLWLKPRSQQDLMHSHPTVQFLFFDVSAWEPRLYTSPFRGSIAAGLLSEEEVRVKPPQRQTQQQTHASALVGGL